MSDNQTSPGVQSILARLRRLFTRIKLPGWLVLILLALREIPDWKHRIDFWIEVARHMGGGLSILAGILASSFFTPALATLAILYLLFVGEPKQGVQRHPWWPYFGWLVFAFCFATIAVPIGYGALEIYLNAQVNSRVGEFQRQAAPTFWRPTNGQKQLLGAALSMVPEKDRFQIQVLTLISSNQSQTYANELLSVFADNHWMANGTMDTRLRPDLLGLYLVVSPDVQSQSDAPIGAQKLSEILIKAQIPFKIGHMPGLPKDSFALAVGAGPEP